MHFASKRRSIARTAALLLPLQIVFRAGEALLPLLLAGWFGRSHAMDIYYFAWAVFTFAGSLVFSIYQDSAIVPILAEVKLASGRGVELARVLGSLMTHTLVGGGALAALIGVTAWAWFRLRYGGAELDLATHMVPAMVLFLVALSLKTFFGAVLNADHHYFAQPIASGLGMTMTLSSIALGRHALGVLAIPLGQLAGESLAVLVLAWFALGPCEVPIAPTFARPEPVKKFARLTAAAVGGGAVTRVNPVIDQLMAGLAGIAGGGTLLRYSGDVSSLPTSLLQATLLSVLLTHLAEDFASKRVDHLERTLRRALGTVVAILATVSLVLFLIRKPLLALVFLRGEMDAAGVEQMTRLFAYHLLGVAPFGALLVLARAHVATHNSGIMFGMGVFNAACNTVFNVLLLRVIGLEGIALSTSCVHLAVAIVLWLRWKAHLTTLARSAAPDTPGDAPRDAPA